MKTGAVLTALADASSAAAAGQQWQPSVGAAASYASHRHGVIAFAVRTPTRHWGWHATRTFPSASVLKAMLLVAYLDLPSVRARPLGPQDRALLAPMIRRSDNVAAGRVLGIVGAPRLRGLAHRAGMRRFRAGDRHLGPEPDRRRRPGALLPADRLAARAAPPGIRHVAARLLRGLGSVQSVR